MLSPTRNKRYGYSTNFGVEINNGFGEFGIRMPVEVLKIIGSEHVDFFLLSPSCAGKENDLVRVARLEQGLHGFQPITGLRINAQNAIKYLSKLFASNMIEALLVALFSNAVNGFWRLILAKLIS
jgi:hypothetical protein